MIQDRMKDNKEEIEKIDIMIQINNSLSNNIEGQVDVLAPEMQLMTMTWNMEVVLVE